MNSEKQVFLTRLNNQKKAAIDYLKALNGIYSIIQKYKDKLHEQAHARNFASALETEIEEARKDAGEILLQIEELKE